MLNTGCVKPIEKNPPCFDEDGEEEERYSSTQVLTRKEGMLLVCLRLAETHPFLEIEDQVSWTKEQKEANGLLQGSDHMIRQKLC